MATFAEMCYACLDLLKLRTDDAYYTEEHILFLISKIRAVLLGRKYSMSRNSTFKSISDENKQLICLDVEPSEALSSGCAGGWLKTTEKIPSLLINSGVSVYPVSDVLSTQVTYIPVSRMPYVGHNKWLKNIIYCAKSEDGYLYLHSVNPNFLYLEKIKAEGVFANPEEAYALSCDEGSDGKCDIMDKKFPLETELIPSLIEMVVQELIGSRYAPEDKENNAKDDLGSIGVVNNRHSRPVENTTYRPREEQEA